MILPLTLKYWLCREFIFSFSNETDSNLFYHVRSNSSFYHDLWCQIYHTPSFRAHISLLLDSLFHPTGPFLSSVEVPHCFNHSGFVIFLSVWNGMFLLPALFFFFFKTSISRPLFFFTGLECLSGVLLPWQIYWDFDWNELNLQVNLGRIDIVQS